MDNHITTLLAQCGVQDYKLVLLRNTEERITMRDGEIDQMQMSDARSLCVNLMIDGRDGFYYTNDLTPSSLERFIRDAVDLTRCLTPDENRTLADARRYYRGGMPSLQTADPDLAHISTQEKVQLVRENHAQLLGSDPRIISAETQYTSRQHQAEFLISNGFRGEEETTTCTLTDVLTLDAGNGIHPMDGWGQMRIRHADIPHEGIAQEALRRAQMKVGQRPVPTGQYTMIVAGEVAGHLLQPLLRAMQGKALQQKSSFLHDRLDQPVGSPLLSLVDDPHIPATAGACYFDFDGVATQRRWLFHEGILRTYFLDTSTARKLNMEPTTQGTHHTIFTPGELNLEQLIRQVGDGILVTDFNGGNCDPVTGQFSYGIEGHLIRGGQLVQPICGMNITGSMLSLWHDLCAVGNDADPHEYDLIPSLVFRNVAFGGL